MPLADVTALLATVAVGAGCAGGALLRWALGTALNPRWPQLPPGTLAANLLGALLAGMAARAAAQAGGLPPLWALAGVTGVLGGLTTFSAFSAEVVARLREGQTGWAAATVLAHSAGALALTAAGWAAWPALRGIAGG
jgi:CrcB protein